MKEVLRTHQQSLADAACLTLKAEGIEAQLFDEHAIASIGLAGEIRVMVAEADMSRAMSILASMERETADATVVPRSWVWQRPALKLLAASFVLFLVAAVAADNDWPGPVMYSLIAAAGLTGFTGLVLLVVGMVFATREQLAEGRDE